MPSALSICPISFTLLLSALLWQSITSYVPDLILPSSVYFAASLSRFAFALLAIFATAESLIDVWSGCESTIEKLAPHTLQVIETKPLSRRFSTCDSVNSVSQRGHANLR